MSFYDIISESQITIHLNPITKDIFDCTIVSLWSDDVDNEKMENFELKISCTFIHCSLCCSMRYQSYLSNVLIFLIFPLNQYGCFHSNFVDRTNVPGEKEFLFVPYSVFTVREVVWHPKPTWRDPHVVHLDVAVDNRDFDDQSLPLAPWG